MTKHQHEEDLALLEDIETSTPAQLIVYNDDVNSFDWVIDSFVKICRHSSEQAEQLSYMIHFNGKATVKTGEKTQLRPMRDGLVDRGLSAVIE